jgi:hypothetical protein
MRLSVNTLLLVLFSLLFSACSDKVYEPNFIVGDRSLVEKSSDNSLFMQHSKGLTFDDGTVISKKGLVDSLILPKGYAYLNEDNNSIIAADNGGEVLIKFKNGLDDLKLTTNSRVLSATIKDDLMAVVNVKNEMKLYALSTQKEIFTFAATPVTAIDVRLASPKFFENLIFFPTLDGKIQIYSEASKKMIRTMSVSTQDQFNNIIFFDIIDKKIVAATGTQLYLFSKKSEQLKIPVRDVVIMGDEIIVLRKDGRIVAMNIDLEIQRELKFPFAYFLGAIVKNDHLYVVENEGYLLKIGKNFKLSLVYQMDFELDMFFASQDTFYFSDGYFKP